MSAELGYDTTNLRALQAELRRQNAAAYAEGLFGKVPAPAPAPRAPSKAARSRGRAAARRLLAMAGRLDGDDSPDVPGTSFTEAGVVRLLAHLRRRRGGAGPWSRFLSRLDRGLGVPVASGQHTVAGVGLARLQIVCRQMREIERHGPAYLAARRAVQRRRIAEGMSLMLGAGAAPPLARGSSS